jgi:hypothetical protein
MNTAHIYITHNGSVWRLTERSYRDLVVARLNGVNCGPDWFRKKITDPTLTVHDDGSLWRSGIKIPAIRFRDIQLSSNP